MGAEAAPVKRGWAVRRAGFWNPASAADFVVLDAGDRHRRRIRLKGEGGTEFLLDLDEAVALRDGDGIMLDDGGVVLVSGQAEPPAEIAARTPVAFVRLAWHLGQRHAHVQRSLADLGNDALRAVAELAAAFAPSKERHLETTAQGAAFIAATKAAWPCDALDRLAAAWDGPVAYPIAVGVTAAGHGIALEAALHAYLHAVTANLISAGVRLVPLGQSDGQRVLAALEPVVEATAKRALNTL